MRNFGYKIIDADVGQIGPVVDHALAKGRPLEVGIYHLDPAVHELLRQRLASTPVAVNAHAHHERCHVFNFHQSLGLLEAHIDQAKSFGSTYSVVHAANMPLTPRAEHRMAVLARLLDNLERAEAMCTRLDYCLHVENVYHRLDFYRQLFDGIAGRGLKRIHFCFDIGHAKVWSAETLDQWLDFLDVLAGQGFRLHFHLHANQGLTDEHLALAEARSLAVCGPDGYFNAYGYPGAYAVIGRRFPDAVKVFEVKPDQAIANLEAAIAG
jgi:sugar phosphate isomerase/epimerase